MQLMEPHSVYEFSRFSIGSNKPFCKCIAMLNLEDIKIGDARRSISFATPAIRFFIDSQKVNASSISISNETEENFHWDTQTVSVQ